MGVTEETMVVTSEFCGGGEWRGGGMAMGSKWGGGARGDTLM